MGVPRLALRHFHQLNILLLLPQWNTERVTGAVLGDLSGWTVLIIANECDDNCCKILDARDLPLGCPFKGKKTNQRSAVLIS